MPATLTSHWGLGPVVVAAATASDGPSASFDNCEAGAAPAVANETALLEGHQGEEDYKYEEPTGRVVWDCARVLYDLLADPAQDNTFSVRGKRVIELGAGTGALSVGLSRAGAAAVTCTDLPCHLARIKATVDANKRSTTHKSPDTDTDRCYNISSSINSGGARNVLGDPANHKTPAVQADVRIAALRWGGDIGIDSGAGCRIGLARDWKGARVTPTFDVIVLSEVLYWPALDLFEEDTREPLRRTLVELSNPGTLVVLLYKERWLSRETEFLTSCEESFEVRSIPRNRLSLPTSTSEDPGSDAIRAVVMVRRG